MKKGDKIEIKNMLFFDDFDLNNQTIWLESRTLELTSVSLDIYEPALHSNGAKLMNETSSFFLIGWQHIVDINALTIYCL